MKKTVLIVLALALLGIGLAVVMFPAKQDVALMQYKDQRFAEAQNTYEQELQKGNISIDVIRHLMDMYLQQGRIDEAILVVERFIKDNPENVEARLRLGTLYQYAQRPDDYKRNLEEVAKMKPTPEVLKELSSIYGFNSQYQNQITAMEDIIERDRKQASQYYADLAYLQASQKLYPDAIASLTALRTEYPEKVSFEHMELFISLLMDNKQQDQAYLEAESYLVAHPEPEMVSRLANIIHYKGSPALAMKLIQPYEHMADGNPDLRTQQVLLYLVNNREQEAYDIMKSLYDHKELPRDLWQSFVDQSIRRGDTKTVEEIVKTLDIEGLSEPQLVFLVELSQTDNQPALYKAVNDKMTPETLDRMPVLDAMLALHNNDAKGPGKALVVASREESTAGIKMQLARACIRSQNPDCAISIMSSLPQDYAFTGPDMLALGEMYLASGQAQKGYDYISKAKAENPDVNFNKIWPRLAVATGKSTEMKNWMAAEGQAASVKDLTDLYYVADNYKQNAMAMDIARAIHAKGDTVDARRFLASAYLKQGSVDAAIPLLRANRAVSARDEESYVGALYLAAKKNPSFRNELAGYYEQLLKSSKITNARRQQLVYALIEQGRADLAIPYVRQYAYADGGDWGSLYEEAMTKAGNQQEVLNYRLSRAAAKNADEKEINEIAYNLLGSGYNDHAMELFKRQAVAKGPDSDPAKQVLWLMGPRPVKENLNWIAERTKTATGKAQTQWMRTLVGAGGSDHLIAIVDSNPAMLKDNDKAELYVQALADSGQFDKLDATIKRQAEKENNPKLLRQYARLAQQYSQLGAAKVAFQRLEDVTPGDPEAKRGLGLIAFSKSDYSEAKKNFNYFVKARNDQGLAARDPMDPAAYEGEYEAFFYAGEILRRDKREKDAKKFYQHTVNLVGQDPAPSVGALSIAAQAYHRVGDTKSAFEIMEKLVAENPNDTILRADYIYMLTESKKYREAGKQLDIYNKSEKAASGSKRIRVATVNSGFVRLHQLSPNKKELMLYFVAPVDEIAGLKPLLNTQHPSLGYTNSGYDSLLIASNYEYGLDVEAKDGTLEIYTSRSGRAAQGELGKQAEIRMELLSARLELETGKQDKAVKRLEVLEQKYPDDGQVLGFAANANYYTGRWRRGLELSRRAQRLMPENEDIASLQKDISKNNRGFVKLDGEWIGRGNTSNEYIVGLHGFNYVKPGLRLGGSLENNTIDAENIRRADGRVGSFNANKQRLEAYVRYDAEGGAFVKGSVYANNDTPGAGLRVGMVNFLGETQLYGEFRKSHWLFVEGVLDDATRDRVALSHDFKFAPDFTAGIELSYNNYNVKDFTSVTKTGGVGAYVRKGIYESEKLTASLGYSLDAEYRDKQKTATDIGGVVYDRFPMRTREIHFGDVTLSYDFNPQTNLTGYVGYAYDRFGGHGPAAGAELTHEFTDNWEGQVRASYGIDSSNSDNDIARAGGYMKYKF